MVGIVNCKKLNNPSQLHLFENLRMHKISQHPELSAAASHPNTDFYQVKTVPGAIKSLVRLFCATLETNSTQLRAGPDFKCPRVWGPGNGM